MSLNKDLRVKYKLRMVGVKRIISAGETESLLYKLEKNKWLSGIRIILKDHDDNDCLDLNIVDKEYLFKGKFYPETPTEAGIPGVEGLTWAQVIPDGVVLDAFGKDVQVSTDKQDQGKEQEGYWARLLQGMYIEIKYKSSSLSNVLLKANLFLHEDKTNA